MNTMSLPTTQQPTRRAARIAISAVFFFNGMGFASWVTRIPAALSYHLRAPAGELPAG